MQPNYRDSEAYHLARHLLVDAYSSGHTVEPNAGFSDRLSRTVLSLTMGIVDGSSCEDATLRRQHLEASLRATGELAEVIERCRQEGEIPSAVAEEMLDLRERVADSLRSSLADVSG
ncbi:MAG: hypothetical protein K8J08_00815 [Thermoanaerobaculia bacterium]|nr:hypothetical protein [Thermoanaerobaculia bacterium]